MVIQFHQLNLLVLKEAIKNRFGGNKESKKMQKTILKKNYENFAASSQEGLDKTYVRRNKSDLDTLSMDDLYNNLKVYESEIKSQSSSSLNSQNVVFVSSGNTSSTNETINIAHGVSAAKNEDLEQINTDDLEEIDLKWQVSMLTMRVKRFIKKTKRKLDLNGKDTVGFDKTNVKCYNWHMRGHFARECRALRNQWNRNSDAPTRNESVYTSTTNALVVQDRIGGYDWSFQAKEELTNFALMAHTSSLSSLDSEDWESDSEDENVFEPKEVKKIVKPSLEKIEYVNARNTTVENENKAKKPRKFCQSPRGTKANIDSGQAGKKTVLGPQYVLLPLLTFDSQGPKSSKDEVADDTRKKNIKKRPLENNLNKNMRDCLVKGRMILMNPGCGNRNYNCGEFQVVTISLYTLNFIIICTTKDSSILKISISSKSGMRGSVGRSALGNLHLPNKVYKVEKALYSLHQAPKAWYETLSTYLLENRFRRGIIDKTLFIKKDKGDTLFVQMSSMRELTFFLGLQVMQKDDGIFISQDKYVADILKKFDFSLLKTTSTLIKTNKALLKDEEAEDVDFHLYISMIGSLMYLTASRPDIRKRLISWQYKKQTVVANSTTKAEYVAATNCYRQCLIFQGEGSTIPVESHHTPTGAPSTLPPHLSSLPRSSIRQETKVPRFSSPTYTHVVDDVSSIGVDVRHGGAATTVTSLDAGQGSGKIDKTPSMRHDSPLPRVNTLGSDEGSMTLQELTVLCTTLSQKVESLEADFKQTKKVYGAAYTKLIMRVKKLEKTVKTSQAKRKAKIVESNEEVDLEDPSKQGKSMIEEINQDAEVTLTYTRRRAVSTAEESVSTVGASMPVSTDGLVDKEEEWENIRARVEADEELTQRLQAEEMDKYSEVDQAK
nr:hypothetical protein [Tanacetum cinerariifolium]